MRYANLSKWMLAAGMALAGASALPAADWRDVRIARQRDLVAADRARLDDDYRCGRRWAVSRDSAALSRDRRTLDAMVRDLHRW